MAETTDLQARARVLAELLRPHPHRGDLIAAGAVPLTVALLLINVRLDDAWGTGIFLFLTGLAAAAVLAMGVLAPLEEERPRAYQVVLQLCGLALLFVALLRLAQVFGVGRPLGSDGASFWMLGVVATAAAWLARERRSAICTLVAAIAGTFSLLAFVSWAFSTDGSATSRWVLLFVALGLLVGALVLRDRHRAESVYLIDAAGFAVLAIGLTYVGTLLFGFAVTEGPGGLVGGFAGPGAWWKLVLLAAGLGLVAYAGVDREAGPGYLGVLILLVFVVLVGQPGGGGPSLWFWPMVLLLVGGGMIAAGLRPREPLPPEPGPAAAAPVVPVAPPPPSSGPARASARPGSGPVVAPAPEPRPALPEPPAPPAAAEEPAGESTPPPAEAPPADRPAAEPEPPAARAAAEPERPAAEKPAERPPAEPEPPARGSLWARADPGEQQTIQHPAQPRERDDDA
jgi:hypothetical protein